MLMVRREARNNETGLTLIEVLISMIIMSIVSTMLIATWINLQRASARTVSTSNARASARDAVSRISSELRGAQPTSLPTASPSPTLQPPVTMAAPMAVSFNSSFNSASANADGSGLTAMRPTKIWLDVSTAQPAPWSAQGRTLYLQRDMNNNGLFTDPGDKTIVLARDVVNSIVPDPTTDGPSKSTSTPVFRYAYRATAGGPVLWTDNETSSLSLGSIIAIRVRVIVDSNMLSRAPDPVDLSTTVRLRNASSN
jgi:prepilin-type N-terminal cleavage/methylation domain-containing protein